ncbi:Uncharacterised protein [Mycobacteroides abscessus subsp. abscessus]|nr:Uncharacterised protein [Mycobacteroides abscessus subsp. abscessus]
MSGSAQQANAREAASTISSRAATASVRAEAVAGSVDWPVGISVRAAAAASRNAVR